MFDQLYTLADGQCVYQGKTNQLVPFLKTLNLECPSYHNPASYVIEVACGEHGDNTKKLVNAIENGKRNVKSLNDYPDIKQTNIAKINANDINLKSNYDKNVQKDNNKTDKYSNGLTVAKESNVEDKEGETVIPLLPDDQIALSPERYPTSELHQFWVVLKRTLLFSRRDWTLMYLRLFAHILVGFLIGALYYNIGNDGAKVLSNLGFLFFNMLFLMYTSMTITILSCE